MSPATSGVECAVAGGCTLLGILALALLNDMNEDE
jgi:hypothetical protein